MKKELFGEYTILRPSKYVEEKVKKEIKKTLFKEYKSAVYKDYKIINKIIKKMMKFYADKLDKNIEIVASIEFLEIILEQYNISCLIDNSRHRLNYIEYTRWSSLGPILRRALKYMGEKVIMLNSLKKDINISKHKKDKIISEIFISAEELAYLYMMSDSTYRVFKEQCELKLDKKENIYWDLKVNNTYVTNDFPLTMNSWSCIEEEQQSDLDIEFADNILNKGMEEKFGISFINIKDILMTIVNDNGDIQVIKKEEVLEYIKEKWGIEKTISEEILAGFSIISDKLLDENRDIYLPKQEYRALYRGFFEFEYNEEKYLIWSKYMARECFILLLRGSFYKKFPNEWQNRKINKAINNLSDHLGKKFEKLVKDELDKLGIKGGINFKKRIGNSGKYIDIPSNVGEIDYLGINLKTNEFIVVECKMISPALEARMWFDDISKFKGKDGYIEKFNRKIKFISENKKEIVECLAKSINLEIDLEILESLKQKNILLTYYPSIIKAFLNEFEIYNLSEYINLNK